MGPERDASLRRGCLVTDCAEARWRRSSARLTLLDEKNHAIGISLWENRESAEHYRTSTYPKVLEKLQPVIQGSPTVETYEVATSTLN